LGANPDNNPGWADLLRSAFSAMRSLGQLNPAALFFALIIAAIDVWILVYLFKPDVKQAFGAANF
jgi:hypothetical protein